MSAMHSLRVSEPGDRLDRFVAAAGIELSRAQAQRLIDEGFVRVDGVPGHASQKLRAGQRVDVAIPPPVAAPSLTPQALPGGLHVLFEDAHLLVVDKPAGVIVHPAPGHLDGTLVHALLAHVTDLQGIGGELRPGIVHRLDKDTSGLMVVAKTQQAHQRLTAQFKARDVHKTYLALAQGRMAPDEGVIDAPVGRDPRERKRMAVVESGRSALTRYRVVRRLAGYTLAEAYPETGRTHQIRVHFAHLGHPLAGDRVYSRAVPPYGLARHFLHAHRLAFQHPATSAALAFEAPLPADLSAVLDALSKVTV